MSHETTKMQRSLELQEVPTGKWERMIERTGAALVIGALAVFSVLADMSPWVTLGMGVLTAHIWSGQVVNRALLLFGESLPIVASGIRAVRRALKGNGGSGP